MKIYAIVTKGTKIIEHQFSGSLEVYSNLETAQKEYNMYNPALRSVLEIEIGEIEIGN